MVMSVPTMSLSIEPASPAIWRTGWRSASSGPTSPLFTNSASSSPHSRRSWRVPVREPSPPITINRSMPEVTRFLTAVLRPSRSRNSRQRAVPMTVPPLFRIPETSFHPICLM